MIAFASEKKKKTKKPLIEFFLFGEIWSLNETRKWKYLSNIINNNTKKNVSQHFMRTELLSEKMYSDI